MLTHQHHLVWYLGELWDLLSLHMDWELHLQMAALAFCPQARLHRMACDYLPQYTGWECG